MPKPRDAEDAIREVLVRELETVNVYEEMVARARTPRVRELLADITAQEKHHIAEAVDMLCRHDAGQRRALQLAGLARPAADGPAVAEVAFEPSGRLAVATADDSLLVVATNDDVAIRHDCGGHGVCGTCRVEVLDGAAVLSPVTDPERRHLGDLLEGGWRLACQTKASGNVRVRIPAAGTSEGADPT